MKKMSFMKRKKFVTYAKNNLILMKMIKMNLILMKVIKMKFNSDENDKNEFNTNENDKNEFKLYHKVRDHCHYNGKCRGGAHNICN